MEEARSEIVGAIGSNFDISEKTTPHVRGLGFRLKAGMKRLAAEHTKMEFLFRALDGSKAGGVVWQYLFKPFVVAENAENEMRRKDAESLKAIFSSYTAKERARWFTQKIYIPEAWTRGSDGTFTKEKILSIALNWGNEYNRDALMKGYGWTEPHVELILSHLDERDWKLVQDLWDHLDTYWPAAERLERDMTGLAPEKVEASPFRIRQAGAGVAITTVHTLRGGYYPITFDRELSTRQAELDEKSDVSEAFGGLSSRAMTRHGHLKARENTGGRALLLELSVASRHLNQVIHDLTHRRAVVDVAKLTRDPEIQAAIEGAVGRETYQQLNPWLKGIAGDRPKEHSESLARAASWARSGVTVVGLGLRISSSVLQTLGYSLTVKELGAKYSAKGLRDVYRSPLAIRRSWEFATERSQQMRDRLSNYDRDVRDTLRKPSQFGELTGHGAAWFAFIGYMDMAVSLPSWMGAYRKAMDGQMESIEGGDEQAAIDYADSVVRTTQAAGAAKDLAGIQRGHELQRLFTIFYSSMSTLYNQFYATAAEFRQTKDVPRLVASLALLWFVPAVMEELLRGHAPGGDDDDDDGSLLKWLIEKELFYPFQVVVGVRDIANGLERLAETGRSDYSLSPVTRIGEAIVRTGKLARDAVSSEHDVTRSDLRAASDVVGYVTHLPTGQLWKSGEYFTDWLSGEVEPSGPVVGLWQMLMTGKPRN